MSDQLWRVGEHYGIHVYAGDRPVATFLTEADARLAVYAHNVLLGPPGDGDSTAPDPDRPSSPTPLADEADQMPERLLREMQYREQRLHAERVWGRRRS